MDENSKISIDMAYKGIEEALRALNGGNMALKSEREKLFKELQERSGAIAGNVGIIETFDEERQELERLCDHEFYEQQQLEAELFAEVEKLMICKSMLKDLKESAAEAQMAAAASKEWKHFIKDLTRDIESNEEKLEDNKAELQKALSTEETALEASRQLLMELVSLKEAQNNVMKEVEKKSTELSTRILEIKEQCQTIDRNESALMDTIAAMEEESSNLHKTSAELIESQSIWEKKYAEKCICVKLVEEECQAAEMQNLELQAQVREVRQTLTEIRDALNQQETRKKQLECDSLKRTQSFNNELNILKTEKEEFSKVLQTLENEATTAREAKIEKSVKNSELITKVQYMEKEAELIKLEVASTISAIESASTEINDLKEKIIREESNVWKQGCELLTQSELLNAKEEDVERLSQKRSLLQAKGQEMEKNIAKRTEDSEINKNKMSEKKDLICQQRQAVDSVKQDIAKLMVGRDARAIEVRRNMDRYGAEISSLEAEIEQLKNHLAGLRDENSDMLANLKCQQQRALALEKDIKDTETGRLSYVAEKSKESDNEAVKFELKKVDIRSAYEQTLAEIVGCEKEMAELEKIQAEELISTEEDLTEKIREKEVSIQALTLEVDLAHERIQDLQREAERRQKDIAEISTYIEQAMAEIANLRMDLAKKEEKLSSLNTEIENSENSHADALTSLEGRRNQEVIEKNLKIQDLSQQKEEFGKKISALEREIASLNESASQLSCDLSILREENKCVAKGQSLAEAQRTKLEKQLAKTKKARSDSLKEVDLATKKLSAARKELTALNDEQIFKNKELEELIAMVEERTSERDLLAPELATKKNQLNLIREKINELRDEGKTLKEDKEFFKKLNGCSYAGPVTGNFKKGDANNDVVGSTGRLRLNSDMAGPPAPKVADPDYETLSPMTISPILPPDGNPLNHTFITHSDDSDYEAPPAKVTKKPAAKPGIGAGNRKGKNKVDGVKTTGCRRGANYRRGK